MDKQEIIAGILKRFKLDSNAIKRLEEYEYELIYRSFSVVSPETINEAIESYKRNDFRVRVITSR